MDLAYFWENYPKIPLKSEVLLVRGRSVQTIFTPEGPQSRPSRLMRTALDLTPSRRKVQTKAALLTFTPLIGDTRQSPATPPIPRTRNRLPFTSDASLRPSEPCEASNLPQQATRPAKVRCIYAPRKPEFDEETSQSEIEELPGSPQAVPFLRRRKTRSPPRDKLSRARRAPGAAPQLPHSCPTVSSA